MKKLMIMASAIALAAVSQAAAVSWEATGFPKPTGCTKTTVGKGDVKMFVWEFTSATWKADYETAGGIWAAVQKGDLNLDAAYSKAGSATAQPKTNGGSTWTEGAQVYAAVLFLHSDAKEYTLADADFYMENYAVGTAADAGSMVTKLGTLVGGSTGTVNTSWQAVPEPTSALLMLLGMAGLALRRRRA